MYRVFAINGSPRQDRGNTAMLLNPFLAGLKENGAEVHQFYASQLKIKPCTCGVLYCWNNTPGECIIRDSMEKVYPVLKGANLVIIATPKYIPLPGDLQNFINRLCPLLNPELQFRDGRTRARLRDDVHIEHFLLVATGGWWEWGNVTTLEAVVKELAEDASISYGGTIFRPHAHAMKKNGELTPGGQKVLDAIRQAASEWMQMRRISTATLAEISRPMVSLEGYL